MSGVCILPADSGESVKILRRPTQGEKFSEHYSGSGVWYGVEKRTGQSIRGGTLSSP